MGSTNFTVIQCSARPSLVTMVTKMGKCQQKIGYNSVCYTLPQFLHQNVFWCKKVYGAGQFNCVRENFVTPTPIAMVTKILKSLHEIHYKSARM